MLPASSAYTNQRQLEGHKPQVNFGCSCPTEEKQTPGQLNLLAKTVYEEHHQCSARTAAFVNHTKTAKVLQLLALFTLPEDAKLGATKLCQTVC